VVELYVAGRKAGTVADSDRIIREAAANHQTVEYREPDGRVLGTFTPAPVAGPAVPWEPSLTWEELKRREEGEFLTFEELKKRLGWE
jgi:hypothetical protein